MARPRNPQAKGDVTVDKAVTVPDRPSFGESEGERLDREQREHAAESTAK